MTRQALQQSRNIKNLEEKNIQVGKLTSAKRGKNVTIMFCISAMGQFIPTLPIFPGQRINECIMINAPPESAFLEQKWHGKNGEQQVNI